MHQTISLCTCDEAPSPLLIGAPIISVSRGRCDGAKAWDGAMPFPSISRCQQGKNQNSGKLAQRSWKIFIDKNNQFDFASSVGLVRISKLRFPIFSNTFMGLERSISGTYFLRVRVRLCPHLFLWRLCSSLRFWKVFESPKMTLPKAYQWRCSCETCGGDDVFKAHRRRGVQFVHQLKQKPQEHTTWATKTGGTLTRTSSGGLL